MGLAEALLKEDSDWDKLVKLTTEHILNPQVGDRFHEMYSFWMYIVHIETYSDGVKYIYAMDFNPPCELPTDGKLKRYTPRGFQERFFYGTGDLKTQSWLSYCDCKDVSGWYEGHIKAGKEIETGKYDFDPRSLDDRLFRIIA